MDNNKENLSLFKADYRKLAEICAEANNYLLLTNIHITDDANFESMPLIKNFRLKKKFIFKIRIYRYKIKINSRTFLLKYVKNELLLL